MESKSLELVESPPIDWSNYKFHCSSLGALMTDPRSGTGLSETCKAQLLELWIAAKYGRTKSDSNKYVEKGLTAEEDGITLYSRVSKKVFIKNNEIFSNDFIIGTPDIIHANIVRDIKCSWSIHTFFDNFHKPLNKAYVFQINGYWDIIPGCHGGKLVYVLINTPDTSIEQEKSKLRYKMGLLDPEANGVYVMAVAEIEKNSIFDDIDISQRWIEFDVPRLNMDKVYERVPLWRSFLTELK